MSHNSNRDDFNTYRKTGVAVRSQLLAAVDDAFVNELSDLLWGYGQVTILQLLTHLRETYGMITPDQLDENAATLDREWNPDDPLERLWQSENVAVSPSPATTKSRKLPLAARLWSS